MLQFHLTSTVRDVKILYRYAHLLFIASNEYIPGMDSRVSYAKRKESLTLYEEAMKNYETMAESDEKKSCRNYYIKSAYGACRCCFSLMIESPVMEYADLVVGYEARKMLCNPAAAVWYEKQENYLLRAGKYINIARKEEQLPIDIEDIYKVSMKEQRAEHSWYIYYMMGRVWQYAYVHHLLCNPGMAFSKAEKYYKYACDIDFIRRGAGKKGHAFVCIYSALMLLYQLAHDKKKFDEMLSKYGRTANIRKHDQKLSEIKWCIINHDYDVAQKQLQTYMDTTKLNSIQKQQVRLLQDVIAAIQGKDVHTFDKKYSAVQVNILLCIQRYVQKQSQQLA